MVCFRRTMNKQTMKNTSRNLVATLTTGLGLAALATQAADAPKSDWTSDLIGPVANPILFESPTIANELRPLFLYHELNDKFATKGGNVEVYALQFRLKLADRLALIATKDGYIDFNPKTGLSHESGFADIAAGLKYALVEDADKKFLLTPGFTYTIPLGNERVFQGPENGSGQFDLFVSAAKGIGDVQLMANLGAIIPLDSDDDTAQLHYSLQAAYPLHQYFKPFVVLNGYTVLSEGNGPALGSEGYDVINFGTSNAGGETQITLGAGFRSSLSKSVDLGFAYEKGVDHSDGIFDYRFTADVSWKF